MELKKEPYCRRKYHNNPAEFNPIDPKLQDTKQMPIMEIYCLIKYTRKK